jgi:hypothetical protein
VSLLPLAAQQPAPPPKPPEFPSPPKTPEFPAPPASARIWRSQTTGKEYRVWTDGTRLYAEWVNIPPAAAAQGASIRIECRRMDSRWVGTAHNAVPCDTTEGGKRVTNFCRITSKIEFDPPEANRLTGRTEWAHRFDCANCRILEPVWKDFEWVPKEQSPLPAKRQQ